MTSKTNNDLKSLLKDYVMKNLGNKFWDTALIRFGLKKEFDNEMNSDITIIDRAIAAILDATGASKETFMEGLGAYHFHCLMQTENVMLRNVARDWFEFLQNLDYLQWITADQIFGPIVQTFRYEPGLTEDQVFLHCYSVHMDYYPMIKGTLIAAISALYSKETRFELMSVNQKVNGQLTDQIREHVIFKVSMKDTANKYDKIPPTFICQTRKYAERQILAKDVIAHRNPASRYPKTSHFEHRHDKDIMETQTKKSEFVIPRHMGTLPVSPFTFVHILPYHVILNSSMEILQIGVNLQRRFQGTMPNQSQLGAFFELLYPPLVDLSFKNIQSFINSPFILKAKQTTTIKGQDNPLILKGEIIPLQDTGLILYLSSPLLRSFQELERCAVNLCDIPLHDPTRDLLFGPTFHSVGNNCKSYGLAISTQRTLPIRTSRLYEAKTNGKGDSGFTTVLLPKTMRITTGKEQLPKPAYSIDATVLFCDIVNFTSMTKTCTPVDIVKMIDELYQLFDEAADLYDTFRVESIGDAYLVLCGAPQSVPDHVTRIAHTSLAMLSGSKQVRVPNKSGSFVSVRIGFHTGGLVWGIIGAQVPRFIIMGGTVILASRMESHGHQDKIHVTQQVYNCLQNTIFDFEERGLIEIKGMGVLKTYFLVGKQATEETDVLRG